MGPAPLPYMGPSFIPVTGPDTFGQGARRLNGRKLWKRMKKNSAHTSPNKTKRAKATKGFRMGRKSKHRTPTPKAKPFSKRAV